MEGTHPVPGIRVEALTERYFPGALAVQNNFAGAGRKRLCCLIPLTLFPTTSCEFKRLFATENARSASAIAVRESDDKVVGFAHMSDGSMKRDLVMQCLHTSQEGECYIEMIGVLSEVRGHGIGTRLLQFCEARARERNARALTLGVVANNPAKRLYERFGFVDRDQSAASKLFSLLTLFCLFGFPHWGCGGALMTKQLL